MRRHPLIYFLIILSFPLFTNAQSGYEALRNNDFIEARKRFTLALKNDSTQYEGLTGMVILSEISQEYIEFDKYINTLLRHHNDPYVFSLFSFRYEGDYKSIEKKNYPDWVTVKYKINEAIDWGAKNRDRDKLWAKYNAIMPKIKWSMIGPFKNINGSGHVISHPIEDERYSPNQRYKNHHGANLNWVTPLYSAASGRIVFSQHLADAGYNDDAVYYANTFINLDADQTINMQIGRTAALKIWVNDVLAFQNNHPVPFFYDLETLELKLKKGSNRILIKNSTQKNTDENSGSLYFWDGNTYEHDMLAIRFTDTNGKPLETLNSSFNSTGYNTEMNPIAVKSHSLVDYFKNQASAGTNPWYDYCLLKSYLSENFSKPGEEYFSKKYKTNPGIVFYGYLFAKMCQFNGKTEKVYELLSKTDDTKTPFFGLQYEKLQDINLDTEPEKYYLALVKLALVSPSNLNVLNGFVDYYNKTGKQTDKDTFINQSIRKYPKYKDDLEPSLSNYKEKEERFGPAEELKSQKKSIKNLKTGSSEEDMDNAIEYYKDRKKKDKVIGLYKDKIYFTPHLTEYYNEYADYLKEIEKYDEAKQMLQTSLLINPYQGYAYELQGDIAILEGNNKEALRYYEKGNSLGSGSGMFGYSNLKDKIEGLVGSENLKKLFDTPTFSETLLDGRWEEKIEGEDAVVLQYTKDGVIDTNYKVNIYQTLMIKILKESGIEKYNEYDMSFMGNITSARIIKMDGTESTPEKSGSYVVIKNLEVGDLIQIEGHARLEAQSLFGKDFNHQHFVFFMDPVFYSKFDFAVPNGTYLGYKTHKMDAEPVKFTDSFNYDHYQWQNTNLEKIQDEAAFPDYYDFYRSISVSTLKDWEAVNDWYSQTTYQKTDITYEIQAVLDTLIPEFSTYTDIQKVNKIYNYITTRIRYSYVPFLNTRFVPKWPGNTLSACIGDCKDVATLMITMLKAEGIEAYYTLVKTNQYNHLETVPSMAFDHVIVCYVLDGKKYYCDLTTNFYPLNILPEMDNNAIGLLIKPGVTETFHLPNDILDTTKTYSTYTIDAELMPDRDMKLSVNASYKGTAGGNLREQIFRTAQNKYSDFVSNYFGQDVFENGVYDNVNFVNLNDYNNPLKLNYTLTGKGFADKVSGLYIMRMPYLEAIKKTPVTNETNRTNRVDLEKIVNVYPSEQIINLKIPVGYKLAETPLNISHNSPFSNYRVQFKQTPNGGLQIVKRQVFYKNIIEISEFEAFKADYQKLLELDKFKIALVKK